MNHGSLFSGIGGFDLAAEWMGWQNKFHCELNPFCKQVLNYYWPEAESYDNIKETDFTVHAGEIDILTGGFPCQPYSLAGERKGDQDDRHLWPEMLKGVRAIRPRWVVAENVLGIISWSNGMVFEQVQTDLEAEGYDVMPYVLPACAVNADHRRERVWFIAYASGRGQNVLFSSKEKRCERETRQKIKRIPGFGNEHILLSEYSRNIDGLPVELDSIGAYGNAIHPGLAYNIFKAIEQYELTPQP